MRKEIKEHYLKYSLYTYPGLYEDYLKTLPNDIYELGVLIRNQEMHRVELRRAMTDKNNNEIKKGYPWYKPRCHDDVLLTAASIISELFRQDERGFTNNRLIENKIVITCRYVSVLTSSILKAKGIPCRSRAGFMGYAYENRLTDHWINQYWNNKENRWITIDMDEDENEMCKKINLTDMKENDFYFAANAWLDARRGIANVNDFDHGGSLKGLNILAWQLFFDFHALMNHELSYMFIPSFIDSDNEFYNLSIDELNDLDKLAKLMLNPDEHFDDLRYIYLNDKKYRAIITPLLSDKDFVGILE